MARCVKPAGRISARECFRFKVNNLRDWHANNDLEIVYRFKWDDERPTRRLIDVTSSFGEKLYVGYHYRKLLHRLRKAMIAFSLDVEDLGDESGGDGLVGQCYSLYMTADFAWEFGTTWHRAHAYTDCDRGRCSGNKKHSRFSPCAARSIHGVCLYYCRIYPLPRRDVARH